MKLPKRVIIAGKTWTVKTNNKSNDARLDGSKGLIIIGTKDKTYITENFLHEVLGGILIERGHRYHRICDQRDYLDFLFSFDHFPFKSIISDLEIALKDVLK